MYEEIAHIQDTDLTTEERSIVEVVDFLEHYCKYNIVDGSGSVDDTLYSILEDVKKQFPLLKLIHNELKYAIGGYPANGVFSNPYEHFLSETADKVHDLGVYIRAKL